MSYLDKSTTLGVSIKDGDILYRQSFMGDSSSIEEIKIIPVYYSLDDVVETKPWEEFGEWVQII